MYFQSSRGMRLRRFCLWSSFSFLLFFTAAPAFAQAPETVLASVDSIEITQRQVDDSIAAQIYPLQQQLYAMRKAALENLLTRKLLEREAAVREVSIEDLRRQLTSGDINVTRKQIEDAYKLNASFFASMSPDEARERLRLDLENQVRMKHYRAGLEALRKKWKVTFNLAPPAYVSELDDGASPGKGSTKPLVTIVEFSDFECPFCHQAQSTLAQVMDRYGGDVKIVFKHLPLEGHRNSLPAARAAYCAGEQDRFWQFHDALFRAQSLSPTLFEEIASELGLGLPKFQACLVSEQSRAAIVKDLETARQLHIDSTPSFIVNGKLIRGALSFADFQRIIEQELSQRAKLKQSATN